MTTHGCHGRAFAPVFTVPAVSVVKDHMHAGSVLGQIVDSEQLHDGGAFAAPAAWIELTNAQKLRWLSPPSWLSNRRSHHRWKSIEVCHANSLPVRE